MPKLTIDGGENRIYSAFKFFLYTLLAILAIYLRTGSTDIVYALSLSPGDLRHPDPRPICATSFDLSPREKAIFALLLLVCGWASVRVRSCGRSGHRSTTSSHRSTPRPMAPACAARACHRVADAPLRIVRYIAGLA